MSEEPTRIPLLQGEKKGKESLDPDLEAGKGDGDHVVKVGSSTSAAADSAKREEQEVKWGKWLEENENAFDGHVLKEMKIKYVLPLLQLPFLEQVRPIQRMFTEPANSENQGEVVRAVAIGPYHRDDTATFNEAHKWCFVRFLVIFCGLDLDDSMEAIRSKEIFYRSHYTEDSPEMDCDKFVHMLLLDGCFILFVIYALSGKQLDIFEQEDASKDMHEYVGLRVPLGQYESQINCDLLAVDNQIPFDVIRVLSDRTEFFKKLKRDGHTIEDLALRCFDNVFPQRQNNKTWSNRPRFLHIRDLLHLFHWSRTTTDEGRKMLGDIMKHFSEKRKDTNLCVRSATDLLKSSTKFKPRKNPTDMADFAFHSSLTCGTMRIPPLYLDDRSCWMIKNLVDFEQSYKVCGYRITDRMALMADLVQSEKDAALLRENGILENSPMTNKEAADFFRDLRRKTENAHMPEDTSLWEKVNKHHEDSVHRCIGGMKLQYCPNRWVAISLVAGSIITILTTLQTVLSLINYFQGKG